MHCCPFRVAHHPHRLDQPSDHVHLERPQEQDSNPANAAPKSQYHHQRIRHAPYGVKMCKPFLWDEDVAQRPERIAGLAVRKLATTCRDDDGIAKRFRRVERVVCETRPCRSAQRVEESPRSPRTGTS